MERQIGTQVVAGTLAGVGWWWKGFEPTQKGEVRYFQTKTFNEGLAL